MKKLSPFSVLAVCVVLIIGIVVLSILSNRLWGGVPEKLPDTDQWAVEQDMTVAEFGKINGISNPALKEMFKLQTKSDLNNKLSDYAPGGDIRSFVIKKAALAAEHGTKNWQKILIKFCLWFVFLVAVFILFKKRPATASMRKVLLFVSVLVFGVIMGSDPSPMGTVKDAIHLYGSAKAVFPPRMIALSVFLLIVFVANKYICAWGCQVGVLQDLIFRLNQTDKGKAVLGKQIKVPFVISNAIRVLFLAVFTFIAFAWGTDIVEPIDPFKIYKPAYLGVAGGLFTGGLLLLSLFIYRPWCHFFCPFGLVGWLVEKISRVRISVNYETCIACEKCAAVCPSTVMNAILKQNKAVIPDCFACYTCVAACPTESIRFSTQKRTLPPPDHFKQKEKK